MGYIPLLLYIVLFLGLKLKSQHLVEISIILFIWSVNFGIFNFWKSTNVSLFFSNIDFSLPPTDSLLILSRRRKQATNTFFSPSIL